MRQDHIVLGKILSKSILYISQNFADESVDFSVMLLIYIPD